MIECVPLPRKQITGGACWLFDRQLMAHEALGGNISEKPQVSAPLFLSPPSSSPCSHRHFKRQDLQDPNVDVRSRNMTGDGTGLDSALTATGQWRFISVMAEIQVSSVFLKEGKHSVMMLLSLTDGWRRFMI